MFRSILFALLAAGASDEGADPPAAPPALEPELARFVTANLIAIFYHELGHAVIDLEQLPIFGQEEDAADVMSILLVQEMFDEDSASTIAYHTAQGFLSQAKDASAKGADEAWWDVHGSDLQRFYTLVCLFYGGNPAPRAAIADELGLPAARAATCEEEYGLADASWGPVMDDLRGRGGGDSLQFRDDGNAGALARLAADVIANEVRELNADLTMAEPLEVIVEPCGQANAFYDPGVPSIIMCTEFAEYLDALYAGTN